MLVLRRKADGAEEQADAGAEEQADAGAEEESRWC